MWTLSSSVKLLKIIPLAEGKIPPDATLIFEIELYAVTKGPRSIETFKQIDMDNDRQLSKTEVIQTNFHVYSLIFLITI